LYPAVKWLFKILKIDKIKKLVFILFDYNLFMEIILICHWVLTGGFGRWEWGEVGGDNCLGFWGYGYRWVEMAIRKYNGSLILRY
jgi:hypothetical protein